ncbi:hypothetical protein KRR39_04155 [Nocardioides panacis]|uniref:Uncharacterized protein n=1 Tax=Nocardioides panacis TaxID=2849501 RepID=A0A975SZW9_9ACTN|nr:hypothetical protein [Nocardioides panacis]QWZ09029.1 hypothetical protein KRR39_04155 [Nocardioides panacis]
MRYTARSRDRSKNLLALLTGAATFGTVAATGAVTGVAAHRSALDTQAREEADAFRAASVRAAAGRAAQRIPWSRVVTVVKDRPRRTVVHTVVVHRASAPGVASAGAGAPVSTPSYVPPAPSSGSSGRGPVTRAPSPPQPAPQPAPAPAPKPAPAPAPAPAPSSGS